MKLLLLVGIMLGEPSHRNLLLFKVSRSASLGKKTAWTRPFNNSSLSLQSSQANYRFRVPLLGGSLSRRCRRIILPAQGNNARLRRSRGRTQLPALQAQFQNQRGFWCVASKEMIATQTTIPRNIHMTRPSRKIWDPCHRIGTRQLRRDE
jgi:hypothetical protein